MRTETWIEVTRSWIDAAIVRRSRIVRCHRFWRAEDAPADETIRADIAAALDSLDTKPGRVRVLWSAPGAAVDLCPVPIPGPRGLRAVALSHAAAAGLIPTVDPIAVAPLPTDTPAADGKPRAPMAVAVGLSASQWNAIKTAVDQAGGDLVAVHASQTPTLCETALAALHAADQRLAVAVTVEEDGSAIAILVDGQIALARTVDLGASALRRSYDHALRDAGRVDDDTLNASVVDRADAMLHEFGVPGADANLPHGVSPDLVFQMMRPALQRLAFEVKQTLRFTAIDADHPAEVAGPTPVLCMVRSTIPNLAQLLAKECGASTESNHPAPAPVCGSGIRRFLACEFPSLPLNPPTDTSVQRAAHSRMGLAAGTVAALALIGADAWLAHSSAQTLEREAQSIHRTLDGETPRSEAAIKLADALQHTSSLISRELAPTPEWATGIAAAAQELTQAARILRVSGDRTPRLSVLRVEGEIEAPSAAEARETLAEAVERLRENPVVHAVAIPAIDQEARAGAVMLGFRLEIALKESTAPWVAEVAP